MTIKNIILSLDSEEPFVYTELDNLLTDGYEIISTATYVDNGIPTQRLMLRKDETKAAATPLLENVQVRLIQNIEVRETYSKSKQQYFKYLRCTLDDDSVFVNIFDHPDNERNTFKILQQRGWFEDKDWLAVGDEIDLDIPVAVTVTFDGEWYSLVDIMEHDNLTLILSQHGILDMTTPAPSYYESDDDEDESDELPDDNIPFGSGSIDDYEVPGSADEIDGEGDEDD